MQPILVARVIILLTRLSKSINEINVSIFVTSFQCDGTEVFVNILKKTWPFDFRNSQNSGIFQHKTFLVKARFTVGLVLCFGRAVTGQRKRITV